MKNRIYHILFALFLAGFASVSCTDYLERDSDSVLTKEDAFKNFNNFQGFIEVMSHRYISCRTLYALHLP